MPEANVDQSREIDNLRHRYALEKNLNAGLQDQVDASYKIVKALQAQLRQSEEILEDHKAKLKNLTEDVEKLNKGIQNKRWEELEEQNKTLEEQNKILEEQNNKLKEENKVTRDQNKRWEEVEENKILEEQNNKLKEENKVLHGKAHNFKVFRPGGCATCPTFEDIKKCITTPLKNLHCGCYKEQPVQNACIRAVSTAVQDLLWRKERETTTQDLARKIASETAKELDRCHLCGGNLKFVVFIGYSIFRDVYSFDDVGRISFNLGGGLPGIALLRVDQRSFWAPEV